MVAEANANEHQNRFRGAVASCCQSLCTMVDETPKYYAVKVSAVVTEAQRSFLNILCSVSIDQTVTIDNGTTHFGVFFHFFLLVTLNNSR